jgi:hypothetical protein
MVMGDVPGQPGVRADAVFGLLNPPGTTAEEGGAGE